MLYHIFPN